MHFYPVVNPCGVKIMSTQPDHCYPSSKKNDLGWTGHQRLAGTDAPVQWRHENLGGGRMIL